MLSDKCMNRYEKQYPDDVCGYEESTGDIVIERSSDGQAFYNPDSETDEVFLDRLERSKKCKENLFYKEWKPFEYNNNCDY